MADLTQFDLGSARRIAAVVRRVEGEPPRAKPLVFGLVQDQRRAKAAFRIATFSGGWPIDSDKVVTFKYVTNTPNTVLATNLFLGMDQHEGGDCAIAREGTSWFLSQVVHVETAVVYTATIGTALTFNRVSVLSPYTSAASEVSIPITTCSTAAV